jgi:A/G-specific adenine glycosylase
MIGIKLISWFTKNKRDLPWRNTANPYEIWVSEIILQQTRVNQGFYYYETFVKKFPEISSLAHAEVDEVLKMWQGLGYYSRARNMHEAANYIVNACGGKFPSTYLDLLKVKGIGDYTASAIASIAFGEAVPVIDGNVNRVIARLYAVQEPIDTPEGKRQIRHFAEKMLIRSSPGQYNQAVMEFGALQCVPRNPDCETCILKATCMAYDKGIVSLIPSKSKAVKIKTRYLHYIIVCDNKHIYLQRRNKNDIWKGLYEFPLIETDSAVGLDELRATGQWLQWFGSHSPQIRSVSPEITHILTHRILKIKFYELTNAQPAFNEQQIKVRWDDVLQYAVPKVIEKYLNDRCAVTN